MDIEHLVMKARSGNDEAFYELIQMRKEQMYKTAYAYVKNRDDALDIVGDTVFKAAMSVKRLREPAFFHTWLTRILINCCLDHLKKARKVIPMADPEPVILPEPYDCPERLDLHSAVDGLSGNYRTVIILKYFQDMTIRQIAEVMGCPQGTVKTYLHRALRILRLELKEDWQNA